MFLFELSVFKVTVTLAKIRNFFFFYIQMVKVEGAKWWLGLHSYENDGRFRWSDHSVLNYVAWALGRPHPLSRDRKCVYVSSVKGKRIPDKCGEKNENG